MSAPIEAADEPTPAVPRFSSRTRLLRAAQLALAAAVIAYLLRSGQLAVDPLRGVASRWPWWLAAQAAYSAALFAMTMRWHSLLQIHRLPMRLRDTAALVLIGFCFNQVAPGQTGGDIAKALAVTAQHRQRRTAALISIAADRLLGLYTLTAVVLIGALADLPLVRENRPLALFAACAGAALGGLALLLLVLCTPLRAALGLDRWIARLAGIAWLAELGGALVSYGRSPRLLLGATTWSLLLHTMTIATNLCLARALLGPDLPVRSLVATIPMIHLASGVPLVPFGNAGVLEGLYGELLSYAGIAQGALLGLLQRSLYWTWALVGAAVLLVRRVGAERPTQEHQPAA